MIYDCFTFFNENDLLEIRLNVLKDIVDKFVIIEGTKTFSGNNKPLNFDKDRFKDFDGKILYYVFDNYPEFTNAWIYENLQRNYILNALDKICQGDDIIIISDVDEIPSQYAIKEYCKNPDGIKSLEQILYYYYLNLQDVRGKYWYTARILTYKDFFNKNNDTGYVYDEFLPMDLNKNITPNKIRMKKDCPVISNAGWHFSFCYGADKIIEKIKNFSHQEYNKDEFLNKELIEKKILEGKDVFNRKDIKLLPTKIDNSFPEYIINNQQKYKDMIFNIPANKKFILLIEQIKYKIKHFIFSKRKDGIYRIINICGIKVRYKKA